MKYAADFRKIARDALSGKWAIAVVAGVIASLLGALSANAPEIKLNFGESTNVGLEFAGQQIYSSSGGWNEALTGIVVGGATLMILIALVVAVIYFVLGSVIGVGYYRFNLDLVDRQKEPAINTMFSYFTHWKTIATAKLLRVLYVFLWSLLFIFPGIIASYSYAMTGYILSEHPELTASEAIERSKQMMEGNRARLFCLQLSFIGWELLSALTLGIGSLWLTPYKQAAEAAFYREVSGTEYIIDSNEAAPINENQKTK